LHRPAKCDVMLQPAIWTEHDAGTDDAVWTNACSSIEFCSRINDGGRMNLQVTHLQPLTSILSPLCKGRGGKHLRVLPALRFARSPGRLALCKGEGEGEGWLCSFVEERKHQFGFGDDCVVHNAMAFRFCQTFAARLDKLGVDENGVSRQNGFAKFHLVCAHEVADAAAGLRQFEQQDAGHLCHRLDLHDARHNGMTGEMSLEKWLVD